MNEPQRHVICRQTIDLALQGGEADGIVLQNRLLALCHDKLAPALDQMFTRHAPADQHWVFDRMEVDAGRFTPDTLESDFVAAVQAAVAEQIQARMHQAKRHDADLDADTRQRTPTQSLHEAFLFFLNTGTLPWWYRLPAGRDLAHTLTAHWNGHGPPAALCDQLRPLLRFAPVRARLARQFRAPFLTLLLKGLAPGLASTFMRVMASHQATTTTTATTVNASDRIWPESLWHTLLDCAASGQAMPDQAMRKLLAGTAMTTGSSAAQSDNTPPSTQANDAGPADTDRTTDQHATRVAQGTTSTNRQAMPAPANEPDPAHAQQTTRPATPAHLLSAPQGTGHRHPSDIELNLDEGLFIDAAGVVLLHPFIPALFERLDVARDKQIHQIDRALALFHYLATGQTSAPEYALALPKLLCGLDINAPAPIPVELAAGEQAEATGLLHAVIKHWDALGDTSPDALRGTFLVRPGKLFRRGGDDTLQLEPQSFDILLGKLPWGISPVNLPWMPRFLWVEWPY